LLESVILLFKASVAMKVSLQKDLTVRSLERIQSH
jgi:hypothetical protein